MSLGNNIRIARRRRGLTLRELSAETGVTPGALSLIERDRRRPTERTLRKISQALLTSTNELRGGFIATSKADDNTLDKEVELLFTRLAHVTDGDKFLVKKHLLDLPDPAVFASQFRKELGIPDGPFDPLGAANYLNIKVKEDFFEGFEAALMKTENKNIILVKMGLSLGRKNFVIAHELGHFRLPNHADPGYTCHVDAIETYQVNHLLEQEANQFASELLLPEKALTRLLQRKTPSINLAQKVAAEYLVSNTLALLRIVQASSEPCALIVSVDETRKWFKRSLDFVNFVDIGVRLSNQSLAYKIRTKACPYSVLEGSKPIVGESPITAWISGEGFRKNTKLIEESLFIPPYNTILTLLKFK